MVESYKESACSGAFFETAPIGTRMENGFDGLSVCIYPFQDACLWITVFCETMHA